MKKLSATAAACAALCYGLGAGAWTPSVVAQSQDTQASQKFAVASVKRNVSGTSNLMLEQPPGGQFRATNVPIRLLIRNAYGVQNFQIVDAPGWVNTDRFDVIAKAERDVSREEMSLLLRNLLAEHFKLSVRNEERQLGIYSLVVAREDGQLGGKLKASPIDCAAEEARERERARGGPPAAAPTKPVIKRPTCGTSMAPGYLAAGAVTMEQFAQKLSTIPDLGRLVVDRTGLTGSYDIDLTWTPFSRSAPSVARGGMGAADRPVSEGPSLFAAIQEQLGLKLNSDRGPVPVLVIERIERPEDKN